MRILLVEDHNEVADRLTALLKKAEANLEIFHASTLAEGIAKSFEIKADITLLDLILPDSPDWRNTARAISRFHPPVIVVSELAGDPEVKAECYLQNAQNVFKKSTVIAIVALLVSAATSAQSRRLAEEIRADEQT